MKKADIAKILRDKAYSESRNNERLKSSFEENNSYKVSYRLLGNMLQEWKELGFDHFPTEAEAIEMAKLVDPYFVSLFKDERELDSFKSTYEFHKDVWMEEENE